MNNYFQTQKIHWYRFSPKDIYFKSNHTTKKLMPEENILSYGTKEDRDIYINKLTGGKKHSQQSWNGNTHSYYGKENHRAVHVHLKDMKNEFPVASVDFLDYTNKVGKRRKSHLSNFNLMCEINSYHRPFQYVECPKTKQWIRKYESKTPLGDLEGYEWSIGGQGQGWSMNHADHIEYGDINQAICNFLVEMVIPFKDGKLDNLKLCA